MGRPRNGLDLDEVKDGVFRLVGQGAEAVQELGRSLGGFVRDKLGGGGGGDRGGGGGGGGGSSSSSGGMSSSNRSILSSTRSSMHGLLGDDADGDSAAL